MKTSIALLDHERKTLLDHLRNTTDPDLRLRAPILLLLADGHPWSLVSAVLYCSTRTIARWKERFEQGRLHALDGKPRGAAPRFGPTWAALVVGWVTQLTPRCFGLLRSRWCCQTAVVLLWRLHQVQVSRETVRRRLRQADIVWRRPRPVLRRQDPHRTATLQGLRQLLRELPADETVVFQDEVDINLNPDIGSMWMRRGQQAEVVTPGDNKKNYLAGSLHWRTGKVVAPVRGPRRNGVLFIEHLEQLSLRLRRYRKIHVICDNASFHDSKAVRAFVARQGGRLVLHWLPKYAPECNPIERVWWHLREEITRNHSCQTLDELVELVLAWLDQRGSFPVEDKVYVEPDAA